MILDAFQQFSIAQDLSQVVGTYASTNVLDYGIASGIPSSTNGGGARDMGIGDDPALKLLVQVSQTFTSAGAATLQVHFQGAPDDGSGGVGTFVTWWSSPLYALAALIAGARLLNMDFPRPPAGVAVPRFVRLLYQIATATTDAGTCDAYVVLDRDDQIQQSNAVIGGYPAGINIAN